MSHTVARFAVVFFLASATAAAAGQRPTPAHPAPAPAEAALPQDRQPAEQVRDEMHRLLDNYPPEVGRVFKLDPSLMSNAPYLALYPELSAFFTQHPEVVHNPAYFLGRLNFPDDGDDPHRREREQMLGVLAGIGLFIAFMVLVGVAVWLIRLVVTHRRWNKLATVQFETHNKLLDRFTSNEELLAYVQTPAGRKFLDSAPIPMHDAAPKMAAPFSRILWSVQAGIVLLILGIGLSQVSRQFTDDAAHLVSVAGVLALSLGAGFIVSAIAAYVLSRKLGLLEAPATDHA
jgi:hypothetical protein